MGIRKIFSLNSGGHKLSDFTIYFEAVSTEMFLFEINFLFPTYIQFNITSVSGCCMYTRKFSQCVLKVNVLYLSLGGCFSLSKVCHLSDETQKHMSLVTFFVITAVT